MYADAGVWGVVCCYSANDDDDDDDEAYADGYGEALWRVEGWVWEGGEVCGWGWEGLSELEEGL